MTAKVIGVIVALGLLVGLAIGGWQLGWWLKSSAASHNAQIYQRSYGAQSADVQELQSLITQVDTINVQTTAPSTPPSEKSALEAQQSAIINQACGIADNITPPLPSSEAAFVAANC